MGIYAAIDAGGQGRQAGGGVAIAVEVGVGDVRPVERPMPGGNQTLLDAAFAPNTKAVTIGRAIVGPGLPLWSLWVVGAAVVAALALRRWAVVQMREAADADACRRAARLALLVWPSSAESRATRVVCLLKLGDLDAAERALRPRAG